MNSAWSAAKGEHWRKHLAGFEAMLRPVDAPLLAARSLGEPQRIADIGCGSGATTLAIRAATHPESTVHGFDLSPALIDVARGLSQGVRVGFEQVDVEAAATPEELYDRLASRFGVMFFADPPAAFRRLRDWLAPGGRCAFAVWGSPADNAWAATVREVVASVADLPPPVPDAPGPFRYAHIQRFVDLLRQVGFAGVEATPWHGALPIGAETGAAEAAHFALSAFSTFGETLAAAGPRAQAEAHRALTSRFEANVGPDGFVRMDASVHLVVGAQRRFE